MELNYDSAATFLEDFRGMLHFLVESLQPTPQERQIDLTKIEFSMQGIWFQQLDSVLEEGEYPAWGVTISREESGDPAYREIGMALSEPALRGDSNVHYLYLRLAVGDPDNESKEVLDEVFQFFADEDVVSEAADVICNAVATFLRDGIAPAPQQLSEHLSALVPQPVYAPRKLQ